MAYNSRGIFEATDQASLQFVESQAAKIESKIHEEKLVDIQWPGLVKVYSDMDPGDDSLVSYIARPGTGRMTPLANGATDIPRTDVEYDTFRREAYASGLSYGWDDMEIERAIKLGRPLQADKVRAAYRVAEEEKERTVLFGNTAYGWTGILNHPSSANPTGDQCHLHQITTEWAIEDTYAPFEDIRQAFNRVFASSDKIEVPDTLLLPNRASSFLFNMIRIDGALGTTSVWDYIQQNNPYTKMFGRPLKMMMVNELDTQAGATGNAPKAILYNSSIDVLRFILPQDLTFIPPQREAWSQVFYGRMKMGGVQVLRPRSMCVIQGFGATG